MKEKRREAADRPREIELEAKKLHRKPAQFMSLIAGGHAPERALAEIAEREARIKGLEHELSQCQVRPSVKPDSQGLRRTVPESISHSRAPHRADVTRVWQALHKLLVPEFPRINPENISVEKASTSRPRRRPALGWISVI